MGVGGGGRAHVCAVGVCRKGDAGEGLTHAHTHRGSLGAVSAWGVGILGARGAAELDVAARRTGHPGYVGEGDGHKFFAFLGDGVGVGVVVFPHNNMHIRAPSRHSHPSLTHPRIHTQHRVI